MNNPETTFSVSAAILGIGGGATIWFLFLPVKWWLVPTVLMFAALTFVHLLDREKKAKPLILRMVNYSLSLIFCGLWPLLISVLVAMIAVFACMVTIANIRNNLSTILRLVGRTLTAPLWLPGWVVNRIFERPWRKYRAKLAARKHRKWEPVTGVSEFDVD